MAEDDSVVPDIAIASVPVSSTVCMTRPFPSLLKWSARLLLCLGVELGVLLIADTLHLQFTSTPSSPVSDAELQETKNWLGVNLTPEELTSIDVTDEMRDRLRRDPRVQPILKALHQELLSIESGSFAGEPIWMKYGAKSFPLLDYYTQSDDPARQRYGMVGIFKLGKPYTTLWLKKQIKRRSHNRFFRFLWDFDSDWQANFGLNDPQTRAEIINLARANLDSQPDTRSNLDDPYYYEKNRMQFNHQLLDSLGSGVEQQRSLADEAVTRSKANSQKPDPAVQEERKAWDWVKWVESSHLTTATIQRRLPEYDKLAANTQIYVLRRMMNTPSGKLAAPGRALLEYVMENSDSRDRPLAIAILSFHRDPEATRLMPEILNGDFQKLLPLTGEPTLVLLDVFKRYPATHFVQSFREYGNLTGRSYYGQEPRSDTILRQIEQKTPAQTVADWQDWLRRYPDHPGADDATDYLIRALLATGDSVEATHQAIRLLTLPLGDGDARFRGFRRLRVLLDVGLTSDQLQPLLNYPDAKPLLPLLRYALAVHLARDQRYQEAIAISNGLNLTRLSVGWFRDYSYFNGDTDYDTWGRREAVGLLKQMQATLTEQRQQWQQLQEIQQANTAESRYQVASRWAARDGWQLGYLALWNEKRWNRLPVVSSWNYGSDPSANATQQRRSRFEFDDPLYGCRNWWMCDAVYRGDAKARSLYQKGNPNAIALSLYESLLHDPRTPAHVKEKTIFMESQTLAAEVLYFEPGEVLQIHPPAGVLVGSKKKVPYRKGSDRYSLELDVLGDYQRRIDRLTIQMQQQFSQSSYIDDLLMTNYYLTGQKRYLETVIKQYPKGDRAEEARLLLKNDAKKEP